MVDTPIFAIPHLQSNSNQPEVPVNALADGIENGLNLEQSVIISGTTFSFTNAVLATGINFEFTGTPGGTVTFTFGESGVPDRGWVLLKNSTGEQLNVTSFTGGTTFNLFDGHVMVLRHDATNGLALVADLAIRLGFYFNGKPTADQEMIRIIAPDNFTIPAGEAGKLADVGTEPDDNVTFVFKKNGSQFGDLEVTYISEYNWTQASDAVFIRGTDVLTIEAPSIADPSMKDINIILLGVRG